MENTNIAIIDIERTLLSYLKETNSGDSIYNLYVTKSALPKRYKLKVLALGVDESCNIPVDLSKAVRYTCEQLKISFQSVNLDMGGFSILQRKPRK